GGEAADLHPGDLGEGEPGEGALEVPVVATLALPAKAVGDEREAPLLDEVGHVAAVHQRVLQDRRKNCEILLVLTAQLQGMCHGGRALSRRSAPSPDLRGPPLPRGEKAG